MFVENNRVAIAYFLGLIMGFATVVFTGCPSADDDDSAEDLPLDDDDSAVDDDDSAADDDDSAGDDDDSAE
jgi:hypothetical protein